MHVLWRSALRVVSLSPCFRSGVWGVKNLVATLILVVKKSKMRILNNNEIKG
jgi:hypothetical protein